MALATIATNKRHLVNPQGEPFFIFGVNYNGYFDRAWRMWADDLYDSALIARDFLKAQNSGFNVIRLFVQEALLRDIRRDDFTKLDETLSLAQDHHLLVLLTLNDSHSLDIARTAEIDAKIAARYKDVSTILGYDLENEPVFYTLAAAIYPENQVAPIQTSRLVDHYGERVSRAEAIDMQQQRRIPGHLAADQAYYYINGLRLFLEYDRAIGDFARAGKGTIVDFMLSTEAEPWHPLIGVLDGTVETWLQAKIEPIRATGCKHLLTEGWSWLHFAALPASRCLDFQSYHNYPSLSLTGFNANIDHLQGLQQAFPNHPITFGEFGWSNQSNQAAAASRFLDPRLTVLYEAASYAYLRAHGFGGAFKWVLNDIEAVPNPYEANFGVFSAGDEAKPISDLVQHFSESWPGLDQPANFNLLHESEAGFSYRFDLPGQLTIGGYIYQDQSVSWRGEGIAHCFVKTVNQELVIDGHGAGLLSIEPWDLIPTWDQARQTNLYRIFNGSQRTRQRTFEPGESVVFDVRRGAQYVIAMGVETAPLEEGPYVEPKPGEHVLLLGNFADYMEGALAYIQRFAPDFTFAVDQVAGRWAYVSVIAPSDLIADEVLDHIRSLGAVLVERVVGETSQETKTLLDNMARRGQRFLNAVSPIPPQEEPPTAAALGELPPIEQIESYVVQPGDTLSQIARDVYGDSRLWTLIYDANLDKLSDPALIRAGMTLTTPSQN